jgi:uncharacterized lipoprotein YajG
MKNLTLLAAFLLLAAIASAQTIFTVTGVSPIKIVIIC